MSGFTIDPTPSVSFAKLGLRLLGLLQHASLSTLLAVLAIFGGFCPTEIAKSSLGQKSRAALCGVLVLLAAAVAWLVLLVAIDAYAPPRMVWAWRLVVASIGAAIYLVVASLAAHDVGVRAGHRRVAEHRNDGRIGGGLAAKSVLFGLLLGVSLPLTWLARDAINLHVFGQGIDDEIVATRNQDQRRRQEKITADHEPAIRRLEQVLADAGRVAFDTGRALEFAHGTGATGQAKVLTPEQAQAALSDRQQQVDLLRRTLTCEIAGQVCDTARNSGTVGCGARCRAIQAELAQAEITLQDTKRHADAVRDHDAAVSRTADARHALVGGVATRDKAVAAVSLTATPVDMRQRLEHLPVLMARQGLAALQQAVVVGVALALLAPVILALFLRRQPAHVTAAVGAEAAVEDALYQAELDERRRPDPAPYRNATQPNGEQA